MPNWCNTSYVVTGDENEVCDLYEKMRSLEEREESLVENGFGKTWLGNLVTLLGGDWNTVYCRGEWEYIEKDEDGEGNVILRFSVTSAWSDPDDTINFLKRKYPSLAFYFIAEEPGMGYYATNDVEGDFFPERYYFSEPDDPEPYNYEEDEFDDFLRDVGNFLGKELKSIAEAEAAVCEYNKDKEFDEMIEIKVYKVV